MEDSCLKKSYGFINDASRDGNADWWLLDTGKKKGTAAYVYYRGALHEEGYQVNSQHDRVRPAVLVDLTKGNLAFAGCVTSENIGISSSYGTNAGGGALMKGCVFDQEIRRSSNDMLTIRWKSEIDKSDYQICFSDSNSFRDAKIITVNKNSYNCKFPKSGKKYYLYNVPYKVDMTSKRDCLECYLPLGEIIYKC